MSLFRDKNILIGVSASIAAYKSAHLVREFIKLGANVRVVMTPESKGFITPLTLSTLSKNPVLSTLVKEENHEEWNNHVKIGLWADVMVIAPATAKTLSKMANGECDNLLLTTYLSATCPVFFAPAMDLDMLSHQSTQENIQKLISFGNHYIPVSDGELASGLVGKGRMAEPEEIVSFVQDELYKSLPLRGKHILITAGPTFEAIDPVRFIGNHSSGKMGYSLALQAADLGASVTLVSGPTHQHIKHPNVLEIKEYTPSATKKLNEDMIYSKRSSDLDIIENGDNFLLYTITNKYDRDPDLTDQNTNEEIRQLVYQKSKFDFNRSILEEIQKKEFNDNKFKEMASFNTQYLTINSINDHNVFEENSVKILYSLPDNSFTLVNDKDNKIYLVKITGSSKNSFSKNDENYLKFISNQYTNNRIAILKSYDQLLNDKYKVQLNQKTIDRVKNYFK